MNIIVIIILPYTIESLFYWQAPFNPLLYLPYSGKKQDPLVALQVRTVKDNIIVMRSSRKGDKSEIIFKIILIGESGTGKSCLMNRYVKKQFTSLYQTTIGTQFQSKTIAIDDSHSVKLQIWDTAGQQSFRSIIKAFFRNAAAVLLVYNITQRNTLHALAQWKELTKESAPENSLFILVGTHLDEEDNRQVSREEANEWMVANKVEMFFETSAKSDLNVATTFEEITKRLFCRYLQRRPSKLDQNLQVKLHQEVVKKQRFCC